MTGLLRNGRMRLSKGTLFWREGGHGVTLVFLHGSWAESSQWVPLMKMLLPRFHCLAPDLLGFGESTVLPRTPYSVALQVNSLAEFLAGVRSPAVIFVADSLGAWVAARYALRYPDQVRGLVVMAPEGVMPPGLGNRWRRQAWLAQRWSPLLLALWLIRPLVSLLGGKGWLRQVGIRRRELRRYPAACRILFQGRRGERRAELLDEALPGLLPPMWVLQPEGTGMVEQALGQTYASRAGRGKLKPMDTPSSVLWDEPRELADLIQQFAIAIDPQ